jgi:hypothetical protein
MGENQAIGVFGEEVLLWACLLRQSPRRPPPEHVYHHASYLLDELKVSAAAQALPVQSVEDGRFAIVALVDELAMSLDELAIDILARQQPVARDLRIVVSALRVTDSVFSSERRAS